MAEPPITRAQLIDRLNEDLAREYQAIIAYVVYSQVLKGAEYMSIAAELEVHAGEASRTHPNSSASGRWKSPGYESPEATLRKFDEDVVTAREILSGMTDHRGQLSVYLRMCDVPLPAMYGPTADSK